MGSWGLVRTALKFSQVMATSCVLTMLASSNAYAVNALTPVDNLHRSATPTPSFMVYFNAVDADEQAKQLFEEGLKLSLMIMPARAKEALYLLDRAQKLGHPYAPLAILFTNALSLHQNYEFSEYKDILMAYLSGDEPLGIAIAAFTAIEATNYLRHYDPITVMSALNRAIGKNYVPAYYVKGLLMFKLGRFEEGVEQMKKAADLGYAIAQYHLAFLALSGEVEMDMTKAFAMLRSALKAGHYKAFRELGYCFEKGIGTHFDYYEAIRLYEQGFLHGDISAAASYGLLGLQQPNPDYVACFNALAFAYNNGVVDVANALGTLYLKGLGVTQNQEKGFKLIKLAADRGFELAIKNVIICYEHGTGTPKDMAKATEYRDKLDKIHRVERELEQQNKKATSS